MESHRLEIAGDVGRVVGPPLAPSQGFLAREGKEELQVHLRRENVTIFRGDTEKKNPDVKKNKIGKKKCHFPLQGAKNILNGKNVVQSLAHMSCSKDKIHNF